MDNYTSLLETIGEFGIVREVHHPIAIVWGLPTTRPHEIVIFETGQWGEVYSIDKEFIEVLVFAKQPVRVGTQLTRTNRALSVPVGLELKGCIIDPLGQPLLNQINFSRPKNEREILTAVHGISSRVRITKHFHTGVSLVDMLLPMGKGQRELVLGDRKSGKTSFLLSVIKSQVREGTIVVYAAIGKKTSDIKSLIEFFDREKIMHNIVVVASTSYDSPSLINITPYSAMAIAQYFRELGQDSLIVFDDLSSHAKFIREIALLAKRFPGRESYPGDIFYAHSRLLEQAGNYKHPEKSEVSITCLPVVEIVEGDLTGYIPTNIMGITDGHIFFDSNLFYKGRRPAINPFLSVTRVGRQTQTTLKREINRELTAFLGLHERMENFSHFGAELSEKIKSILRTGQKLYRFFNQHYSLITPDEVQLVIFGLIWQKIFDNETDEFITDVQKKMIIASEEDKNKEFFREMVKADTMYTLLTNISKKKEVLFSLCQVVLTSTPK